jgi:type VI secretion system ImpM family protein
MCAAALTRAAGCFGKISQLGDFITRTLPREFVDPWDAFLQQLVAGSREALGSRWLEVYLQAPIWRFSFPAGYAAQTAVAGVLMPSVDKVGRYFPFSIAMLLPSAMSDLRDQWFDHAEALSLDTLEDGFDPTSLTARLEALGTLVPTTDGDVTAGLWETFGSQLVPPAAFRAANLPDGAQCTALLDGDCALWGWSVEAIPVLPATSETTQSA